MVSRIIAVVSDSYTLVKFPSRGNGLEDCKRRAVSLQGECQCNSVQNYILIQVSGVIAVDSNSDSLIKFPFKEESVWRFSRGGECHLNLCLV